MTTTEHSIMSLKEPKGKTGGQFNFNTLVGIVCTGLVLWVGSSVSKLREDMVKVTTSMDYIDKAAAAVERRVVVIEGLLGLKPKQP